IPILITFIRHGLTRGNEEKRYIGQGEDQPLTPAGERLLREYRAAGRYPAADALYTSPLLRCRQTAQLLYPMLVPVVVPGFTEMNFGSFEGKNYSQLEHVSAYRRWIDTAGADAPPGGEDAETFGARLEAALRYAVNDAERLKAQHPVVITHGGCFMALLTRLAGQALRVDQDPYTYLTPNGGGCTAQVNPATLAITGIVKV
ncbi:MAG: histidine phosphatase family protein, partial [Oscillospiraceae bacterium]|nr:histidine phosphatase family protein [Oscillospiraceae bacterium]